MEETDLIMHLRGGTNGTAQQAGYKPWPKGVQIWWQNLELQNVKTRQDATLSDILWRNWCFFGLRHKLQNKCVVLWRFKSFSEPYFSIKKPWLSLIIRVLAYFLLEMMRRKRDSNPRTCNSQQFSRLPQSTTLPALRGKSKGWGFFIQNFLK